MEKIFQINGGSLFSSEHLLLTNRGLVKAKDLQVGDTITGLCGKSEVKNINEVSERPNAPIVK